MADKFSSRRTLGSGRTTTGSHLVPRSRPFPDDAALMPGAAALDDQGQRYFAQGGRWRADLPAGAEVMIPTWQDVPPGWFEIPNVGGVPAGRRLIGNKFSPNYIAQDALSWGIIQPVSLFSDAARNVPVSTPPAPIGGIEEVGTAGNHWVQPVSANRPIWDTYMRDGEAISGLTFEAFNQEIDVPLDGATTGSVVIFYQSSAIYLPADFGGNDARIGNLLDPIEEMIFFDRALGASEVAAFVDDITETRNRQPLDNFVAYGKTDYSQLLYRLGFITEIPVFNTTGGLVFYRAFADLPLLESLPALDFSSATNISRMAELSSSLSDIGTPDFSEVLNAEAAFRGTAITSFGRPLPKARNISALLQTCLSLTDVRNSDLSAAENIVKICQGCPALREFGFFSGAPSPLPSLIGAWNGNPVTPASSGAMRAFIDCTSLADFPANMFDDASSTNYFETWTNCALTQTSVDNILVSIAQSLTNDASLTDGYLSIDGGTSATPSASGQAAADQLRAASWTVDLNGY